MKEEKQDFRMDDNGGGSPKFWTLMTREKEEDTMKTLLVLDPRKRKAELQSYVFIY